MISRFSDKMQRVIYTDKNDKRINRGLKFGGVSQCRPGVGNNPLHKDYYVEYLRKKNRHLSDVGEINARPMPIPKFAGRSQYLPSINPLGTMGYENNVVLDTSETEKVYYKMWKKIFKKHSKIYRDGYIGIGFYEDNYGRCSKLFVDNHTIYLPHLLSQTVYSSLLLSLLKKDNLELCKNTTSLSSSNKYTFLVTEADLERKFSQIGKNEKIRSKRM